MNSQNSIYKPNLRRVDNGQNSVKAQRSSLQVKRGTSTAKLRAACPDTSSQSGPSHTPSQASLSSSKLSSRQSQAKSQSKSNIYKPPTMPIYKKPALAKDKESASSATPQQK